MNPTIALPAAGAVLRAAGGTMLLLACALAPAPGITPLGATAAAAQARPDDAPSGSVSGVVRGRFRSGARPLAFALVEATTSEGRTHATADSLGRYEIRGVPGGRVRLHVAHAGHAPLTLLVRVPVGGEVRVDLELTARPLPLAGVDVSSTVEAIPEPAAREPTVAVPDPDVELRMLEISPSIGEAGITAAIQALPGNDPANPSDVLFMRGSTTELKLVLLDGVPVFTPFHVAGLMRSFEPSVLGSAKLHVGGAPARYDGGLSHILDLRTRSARRDRTRMSGSVDLLSASLAAETPVGERAGVVISGRTLHDLGRAPLGGERPYGYQDVLVSFDADVRDGHYLRATGFWNEESVRLEFEPLASDASWRNRAVSLTYRADLGPTTLHLTAGGSRYGADLPLQPSARPGEPTPDAVLASAETDRGRVVAELAWGPAAEPVRAGMSFEELSAIVSAESLGSNARAARGGRSRVGSAFVDATRVLAPGITLRAGLRGDLFSGASVPKLSPRATLFWDLGPDAILSIAAGRYHQVTRTPTSEIDETLSAFANRVIEPREFLPVATADHVVLSLAQRVGESVSLGLDGFWKRFDGLSGTDGGSVRNSGVDLQLLRTHETGALWIGYGLSWFWSPTDLSGRATEFVGRQLLTAGLSGAVGGPLRAEARVSYGAGLPSTSIPFGSSEAVTDLASPAPGTETLSGSAGARTASDPLASSLEESFLRLDLELHAVFEPQWGDRRWRVRPYLRLINALDQRDALFYTFQPWRPDSVTPLAERPFLPVLGVSFSF